MKIKLLRNTRIGGESVKKGRNKTVSNADGNYLVNVGKAVCIDAPPKEDGDDGGDKE